MAQITIEGIDEWLAALELTQKQTEKILKRSVYPGAKIVADVCRQQINSLVVDNTLFAWSPMRKGITGGWKKALQESMGLSHFRHTHDGWDVKLGFDGYSKIQENRGYVNGKKVTIYNSNRNPEHMIPNAVIARTTEKGNGTNLPAQPFMSVTITRSRANAERVMGEQFIDELVNFLGKH